MKALQFLEIEIEDYRQYHGNRTIDLSTSGSNHINVIEGQNGAGKSNLLNAITLCFYGKEVHNQSGEDSDLDSLPMVSNRRMDELDVGDTAEGYIKITMGKEQPQYIFTRKFRSAKLPGDETNDNVLDLSLKRMVGNDWKDVDEAHTALNEILPAHVRDYFLFDGEALDEFFEDDYQDDMKDAIVDVSHIELLNNSIEHLTAVKKDYRRDVNSLGGEVQQANEELEKAEAELERLETEYEERKKERRDAESELSRVEQKMEDSKNPDVQQKIERRKFLDQQLEDNRERIDELKADARKYLLKSGSVLYSDDALEFTHEEFSELADAGQLPPKIQDWFITEIIDRGECICGRPLDEDSAHVDHLQELQSQMSDVMVENIEGKAEIPYIRDKGQEALDDLLDTHEKIHELQKENEDLNRDLNDLNEELKGYDIPDDVDVADLEQQRESIRNRIKELDQEVGSLERDIGSQEQVVKDKEKELNEIMSEQAEQRELRQKLEFIDATLDDLQTCKEEILAEVRDEIETNMNRYFNQLIWKDEEYTIELREDYSLRVEGASGNNKIGSLSAGEAQVLALSFMSALTQISGFQAPIVIDTPLGRISSEPKKRIAKNIPNYLEDTQITFLMTDEEYNDDVQTYMDPSVEHEYRLDFSDDVTEVRAR
jgi:DNA sulfur modification protein DndD